MARPSFSVDDELLDRVDERLSYGDARSAWLRDAIKMKLEVCEEFDKTDTDMSEKERREFVVKRVRDAIRKQE